jgi:hypothetical protein
MVVTMMGKPPAILTDVVGQYKAGCVGGRSKEGGYGREENGSRGDEDDSIKKKRRQKGRAGEGLFIGDAERESGTSSHLTSTMDDDIRGPQTGEARDGTDEAKSGDPHTHNI